MAWILSPVIRCLRLFKWLSFFTYYASVDTLNFGADIEMCKVWILVYSVLS